jgi:uridine kinase
MVGVPERVRSLASLAAEIKARPCSGAARLVAVDGRAGAGKSTLARGIAAACHGAPVVRVDDFLYWRDIDHWWPRLEREALRPLLAGSSARFRVRDWANDPLGRGLDGWAEVAPADVVIVEGVTSSRQAVAADLVMSLWVEAPDGVRLRRGIDRDGEERRSLWIEWMALEDAFFARDGAPARADYVVCGQAACPYDRATEFVVIDPAV